MNRALAMLAAAAALPAAAGAQVIITEVMYDLDGADSGREWIEVRNVGSGAVDLTAWRISENGTNHAISGTGTLPPGGFAVIADDAGAFRADWPSFDGLLFESSFSLNNDGETVTLRDASLADRDVIEYESGMGGGTGDSLQRVESSFMPGAPTPGAPVPESGLAPATDGAAAAVAASGIIGEREAAPAAAAAAAVSATAWQWWLGPLALATFASAGAVLARRRQAGEWEIEETD